MGRPKGFVDKALVDRVAKLRAQGTSRTVIQRITGCSAATLARIIRAEKTPCR